MSKEDIQDVHMEIVKTVSKLIQQGYDPLHIAGALLAGAVQFYQMELGDDQTTDLLRVISESHNEFGDDIVIPDRKETIH
tara:strand:+ start:888 stop:1127 length:240 start_codon:yes stop_codon:yes gene_type:complete